MVRAWVKLIWNSFGAAVVAVAAQLGIADALGIIRWTDTYETGGPSGWSALLTWIGFIYAVAVLGGAAAGRRTGQRGTRLDAAGARITTAIAAGLGAAAAAAVAGLLSRGATPPVSVDPDLVVTMTAGAGVVVGVIVALLAMSAPPVSGGVRAAVAWIWLVGIASAVAGITSGDPYDAPRLAVLDAPSLIPVSWWSGPYAMVGIAAILGCAVAGVARWGGAHRLGATLSGFAGPAVVAAAYLIAGPGDGADRTPQSEPYQASLIAVGAGLCAALLVAAPGRRRHSKAEPPDRYEVFAPQERQGAQHQAQHGQAAHAPDAYERAPYEHAPYEHAPYEQTPYEHQGLYGSPDRQAADTAEQPLVNAAPEVVPAPARASAPPVQSVMGQPPRSYQEDYADWLKDLGHTPQRDA